MRISKPVSTLLVAVFLVSSLNPLSAEIHCEVFGGIATPPVVTIFWDPIFVEILILRDGKPVADLPSGTSEYREEPLHGEHVYTVIATGLLIPPPPLPPVDQVLGECTVTYEPPVIGGFVRGDCNGDEESDISDPVCILMHLFRGRPDPPCPKSADGDNNGVLEPADAVLLLHYLFLNGPAPAPPFPECGHDNTHDELACDLFPSCFNPPPP